MREITDIKKFREIKNLSQNELADLCGVTVRTVQNWETGTAIPELAKKYLQLLYGKNIHEINSYNQEEKTKQSSDIDRYLSIIEHSQRQIDTHLELAKEKDTQISNLLTLIEKITK